MGRRFRLRPAPGPDDLTDRALHEVVRDYPETLAALRAVGVAVAREGGRRLDEVGEGSRPVEAVRAATAWRPAPPAAPSDGRIRRTGGDAMAPSASRDGPGGS